MVNSSVLSPSAVALPPRSALRRIVLLDIVLPFLAVVILLRNDVGPLTAYAAASLFPASSIVVSWLERHRFDPIGLGVLAGLASALLIAALTGDPRFGLVRAVPAFAVFGLACFVSLATRRPLMFFVARAFAAGGDAERIAAWNARLAVPAFRHVMRRLTVVWGAGTLTHATLGVAVAFLLPASVALIVEPMMAMAILAALLAWTRAVQRRGTSPDLSPADQV
ncbi:MAG TPA: VC0807 family protein [Acetobacteraceae bacterium]|nr:VC0807 family protein [Acetobacteraceae bacterium]